MKMEINYMKEIGKEGNRDRKRIKCYKNRNKKYEGDWKEGKVVGKWKITK